jgi:hypothetical protein
MMKELSTFQNRQVVVNTYLDDELIQRDGFWFEQIKVDHRFLQFLKNGSIILSLEIEGKVLKREPVFKHYFTVNDHNKKIEIYFP